MSRRLYAFYLLLLNLALLAIPAAFSPSPARGQGTKLWTQSTFDEFEKGHADGVAVRSDGAIEAGPRLHAILTTPSTYVWSIAADGSGNAYLATGSPATVLKVSAEGNSARLFESRDLAVQVVRLGPDGALYVATLPSGKVFRIRTDGAGAPLNDTTATLIFDPATTAGKPKYVWDLQFDTAGRLYIAAGGPAAVYRVDLSHAGAKPELFYESDEQHIRCIAFAPDGTLIAGSDGSGLIYKIDKSGKGYVLYDTPKHEITSLAIAPNGAIYASGTGEKTHNPLPPLPVQGIVTATITIVQPGSVQAFNGNTVIPDGSEIYELAPGAPPRKLWSGHDDIVYALRWRSDGLLAATGNRGRIYRIDESGSFADVGHVEASQTVGFAEAPAGGLYLGTSNTGKLYSLSQSAEGDATYTSSVFDAGLFARWGRAEVDRSSGTDERADGHPDEHGRAQAPFELFARAGNIENPERAWSDWTPVKPNVSGPEPEGLGIPAARFVQWKAVLHPGASIAKVAVNYLPLNAAPVVDDIAVQVGARVTAQAPQPSSQQTVNISFASTPQNNFSFADNSASTPLAALRDKTAVTVRWAAHDDNGDDLVFAVYFRGDGEHQWRLLKDKVTDRYYSFDSALLPDGRYQLRVVASDAPSHNPGEALTAEKLSDGFLIDTTAPVLSGLKAFDDGGRVHVTLMAVDTASSIAHAEYSIDAGPWQYVEPVGGLSDSPAERYDFVAVPDLDGVPTPEASSPSSLRLPGESREHLVTVRVYDRYENVSTGKVLITHAAVNNGSMRQPVDTHKP
ncbi:MAG TPA: hypothetical protein VGD59_12885 [Acidisarcina sp.]